MNRRELIAAALGAAASSSAAEERATIPVIDTHIHLFDPTRKEGIPWPSKEDGVLYQPALPDRLRRIAEPLGIRGAIAVEASPWLQDNQWLLDVASRDPIIVGVVGNLEPGTREFPGHLERFRRNRLFLGIRYGNLWSRDLGRELGKPEFVADLKRLASAGLVLDTANPNPALLAAVLRVTDAVPDLRVMIDHLPQIVAPELQSVLRDLQARPKVFVKVSAVLRRVDGVVPADPDHYRPVLDRLWDTFGEDRLVYGSDWPNSDRWGPYPTVFNVVSKYFRAKGEAAAAKYFHKNSQSVYRWHPRADGQKLEGAEAPRTV